MIIHSPNDPLPYSVISIVDVSPYRSPVRPAPGSKSRPATWAPRAAATGLLAGIVLLGAAKTGAADLQARVDDVARYEPAPAMPAAVAKIYAGDIRLAPGHGMPANLVSAADGVADTGFRLAPGNAMPEDLVSAADGVADAGFRLAPGNAVPAGLDR